MKYLFSVAILMISFLSSLSYASASWNSFTDFTYVNGKFCESVYIESCLEWADKETFGKFDRAKELFWENWQYVYSDKNALYFFPVNGEWNRLELDTKNLKAIWGWYFNDGKSIFFASFPVIGIRKIETTKNCRVLHEWVLICGSKVYYNWLLENWINGIKLSKDTLKKFKSWTPEYLVYGSTIFMPQGFSLLRLRGVDIWTFHKNETWYEDKRRIYTQTDWHYGFDFEITNKKGTPK